MGSVEFDSTLTHMYMSRVTFQVPLSYIYRTRDRLEIQRGSTKAGAERPGVLQSQNFLFILSRPNDWSS